MGILASTTYAKAFHQGTNLQALPPNTQIWFVLYAQINQADGSTMRNVELDKRIGQILLRKEAGVIKEMTGVDLLNKSLVSFTAGRKITQFTSTYSRTYTLAAKRSSSFTKRCGIT
jgi:hypothetical protein